MHMSFRRRNDGFERSDAYSEVPINYSISVGAMQTATQWWLGLGIYDAQ